MALNLDRLRSGLEQIFVNPRGVSSSEDAQRRWAAAYHAYCTDVEDLSGDSATNLAQSKFEGALHFRQSRTAAQFAGQIDSAFAAYWTGTSFGITTPIAGPGVPCPNISPNPSSTLLFSFELTSVVLAVAPGAMRSALLPILLTRGQSYQVQASRIATAMHTVTKSAVTVLISGTDTTLPASGGPSPITNTCTVS